MSVLSKQGWLETAEQFEVLTTRVEDVKIMVEFWCGKKKKKAQDTLWKLYCVCSDQIRSLLEKVEFSQYFDNQGNRLKKYESPEIPRVSRGIDLPYSEFIFYNTGLPENFEHYDKGKQSERPRPLLTYIPVSDSSKYLGDLDELNKLIHKVLGDGSHYRKVMNYDDIQLFNEFNDLLQSCTKIIQDITYK